MQLSSRFEQALSYTYRLHHTQVRKGSGIPYMSHLLGVAAIALEAGADEDETIAALLHDSLEDGPRNTGIPRSQIEQELLEHFGPKVLHIVLGCTDTQNDSGAKDSPGSPKESWAERKTAYLKHLEQLDPAHPLSASVLLVSNADKLHNARSILRDWQQVGEAVWERFKGGKEGSLWYYQRLAEIFGRRPSPLSEELQRVVEALGLGNSCKS